MIVRKLSRYILTEFITYLIYTLITFTIIFILVDLVENIDKFIDHQLGIMIVVLYYVFYLPNILVLTIPVAMLLATMFSLGRLVSDNEITAMKSSGISLNRIILPLYGFALFVGLMVLSFNEFVVPTANRFRTDIEEQGSDYRLTFNRAREMDRINVYLLNSDGRMIYARGYKSDSRTASDVLIIQPDDVTFAGRTYAELRSRIDADYMIYGDNGWVIHNAAVRTFDGDSGFELTNYDILDAPFITRSPSDFAQIDLAPEEMNYFQLRNYISNVREKGGDATSWLVDLYMKISLPFISFVIVFFGAPMAGGYTKRGKTASFGIALVIAFIFYVLVNTFQVLGRNGTIDPLAAAWIPNGAFFLLGILMHVQARN